MKVSKHGDLLEDGLEFQLVVSHKEIEDIVGRIKESYSHINDVVTIPDVNLLVEAALRLYLTRPLNDFIEERLHEGYDVASDLKGQVDQEVYTVEYKEDNGAEE